MTGHVIAALPPIETGPAKNLPAEWLRRQSDAKTRQAAFNAVYARYFPHDPPARSFICVLPWHSPFDVEIDCIARTGIGGQ
jgi:hypothetical protein